MNRIPFSQVLKNATVDIQREYDRLYALFNLQKFHVVQDKFLTLRDYCAENFVQLPFRGTCLSLDDFDDYYGHHFEKVPSNMDIDYLVSFCEYTYNLVVYNQGIGYAGYGLLEAYNLSQPIQFYLQQVMAVIEAIGYMANNANGITDFVPKDAVAIAVAEIIDPNISYRLIEYHHYSVKGNLDKKKAILLVLADQLEPKLKRLKQINASLEDELSFLLNNFNIRHNNIEPTGKYYNPSISKMASEELEKWYDETYQTCLLAFLELENADRKNRISQFKQANLQYK